ncbi:MAG: TspO protein [Pelagibacteraceae bacterium BACL5 MAG-120705-bin12]|jgi:translocator protein|uniref:TspO/MBR family protein n=1 Tax=Candidatus Pelagibacter sp. TaxID=2024849 RepID=UPI00071489F6|nr:MAG: TspO protein [Pelagibacteraceae bacterium BACL5 MAG-121015-bin10]KRO58229.1 MAG: TspO protein [Pelagibacteraceae bacterium BACL5 MAG-121128-bin54]KRO61688.1 MAG: TspO protein [Pelagibacteraceae bacterium BACL5 MAG-120705-bin12]KRO64945.1 MAG: TspO protein [Pelagibacteraceae bacterium BACL5 MAG-120820-bin39]KRO75571.1 MAG: TspO protein [Pelagibacteraceae bacterium BACL5 MAG-120813-bin20]MDA1167069.1 tryptophan-rich sensory protein [Pseudomonadota bacterium]
MLKNKILSFLLFLIVTFSASFIGAFATINYKEPWYSLLTKPSFNPPDWVFGPVWTMLYLLMTIAIWKVWQSNFRNINIVYIYFIHLFFNTMWSIVFFVFHNILLALFVLIILIGLILYLMMQYRKINLISFYLMIPYLAWCIFALVLNFSILIIN